MDTSLFFAHFFKKNIHLFLLSSEREGEAFFSRSPAEGEEDGGRRRSGRVVYVVELLNYGGFLG